jgi:uncharacterized protein with HEPN domain
VRDDRERLLDIQEAIGRIEKYAQQGYQAFLKDELIQTWILHHLQVIGEAAGKLSRNFRSLHPEIEWKQIIGFRNILVHHYFEIDYSIVWRAVEKDVPDLKEKLNAILKESEK